ncbi:MAG: Hsp70 family protein, partial [Peptococcaceae bacterium]|nr:Hsp70 family protein [Peptococcaceae bacterium]
DIRNNADAMVFQVEKTLKDMGDKVDAAEVADINKAKDELKAALEGNNTAEIKEKTEALQDVLYKMTEKMYAAAQAAQGADMGGYSQSAPNEDGVYDAEYKEV